ncbi:MAG: carboxypeptidase-like regulatory domain-containing protein [Bacteroidales bacterium]|nr:carboxypeptidase-like regulatory domain-containing protein [Bacteroidales bacterium]
MSGLLFIKTLIFAVDTDGGISGFVFDSKTQQPLLGVIVMVKNTGTGTTTDENGYFNVKAVDSKKCVLTFSLLSYKTIDVDMRQMSEPQRIFLDSESTAMDEIVISRRRRNNTETSMISASKVSPLVTSGISAAQISKGSDRTASEAVSRIPGITVIDEKFIIVRGLSPRYNNVWINGLAVPSSETESRAFPVDIIPSSQIENLLVYKSPTPELPGDFSGGFVNITSKEAPDGNHFEFGYTTGVNVKTIAGDFKLNPGSNTDFLGFDTGKRPLQGFPVHLSLVAEPSEITRLTQHGFNNDWRVKQLTPLPDQRLSFMITRQISTGSTLQIGNITAFTYSNTFKSNENVKNARYGIYSAADDKPIYLDDYTDNQFSNDVRMGVLHNWSLSLNPANRIEFKNLFNILGRNRLTERTGIKDMSSMYYIAQTEMLYSSRLTYSGQLSGRHTLNAKQTIRWNAGYAYAGKSEPDRRIVTAMAGIGSMEDIASAVTGNESIKRYFQHLRDNILSASVNFSHSFGTAKTAPTLKAGVYGQYHNRSYKPREFIYRYDRLSYDERQTYLKLPFQEMLDSRYLGYDKVYIDEMTDETHAYSAKVFHTAGYAAIEIPVGWFTVYGGLRVENHNTQLTHDRVSAPEYSLITTQHTTDFDMLPSINLTCRFNDRHQLRFAYGRSVNRPELREISPAVYYDFDLFNEIVGKEDLKTVKIDNVDLRYEFYPTAGEILSFGVFYKHFRNPIEWTFVDMGGSLRYCNENAHKADNLGVEFDMRKRLDFAGIPDLSLVVNAALIKSNVKFRPGEVVSEPDRVMQGQSPYIINTGIFYQNAQYGLSISALYNRIGERITGIGKSYSVDGNINSVVPDSYEMHRNQLDFTVSKTIARIVEIRCSVKDVFSEDVVYKQFPKFQKDGVIHKREQITKRYNPGQSVSIGVSVKLN